MTFPVRPSKPGALCHVDSKGRVWRPDGSIHHSRRFRALTDDPPLRWAPAGAQAIVRHAQVVGAKWDSGVLMRATAWGKDGAEVLAARITAMAQDADVAAVAAPARLGWDTWSRTWEGPRMASPRPRVARWLTARMIGGRADWAEHTASEAVWETDRNMSYLASAALLPAGTAVPVGPDHSMPAMVADCEVTLPAGLILSPITVRGDARAEHPLEGTWRTTLWTPEIEDAISAGCKVKILDGWGWSLAPLGKRWGETMFALRTGGHEVAKIAAVAAIGAHGSQVRREVSEDEAPLATPLRADTMTALVETGEVKPSVHPEWYGWILASARSELYRRTMSIMQCGHTVHATDFDGVFFSGGPERCHCRDSHSGLGEWKSRFIGSAEFPASRWVVGDNIRKTPGLRT